MSILSSPLMIMLIITNAIKSLKSIIAQSTAIIKSFIIGDIIAMISQIKQIRG